MILIITIIIAIGFSFLLTLLAKKIKIPVVVALIFAGLMLGIPLVKNYLIEPNTKIIFSLGDIGLLFLMFLAGLESSWMIIYKEKRDAVFIAIFAALVPFILGFIVFYLLGFSVLVSAIIGICMSITAEATKARVLLELNKLKTRVGSALMGAGIIDDIIGLCLFILITYLAKQVYLKEDFLITGSIAAFFIGILVERRLGRKNKLLNSIKKLLLIFIIPFFFISMGLNFNISSLILNPKLLIIIILIAITGKLIGTVLTKPFTKFKFKQLYLIGWAMNSRGAVELAIALIAFRSSLIPVEIYSALVIMALLTTFIFQFIITSMIKKNPDIMN